MDIPVLNVKGGSFAEAWENSVLELWDRGIRYQRGDSEDNGIQAEATMTIETKNPRSDFMIHKYSGGSVGGHDLMDYSLEVLGARDAWRNYRKNDYTYHGRFGEYLGVVKDADGKTLEKVKINQIGYVIGNLVRSPWSRRSNMITWVPQIDATDVGHTPCLQRAWFEIVPGKEGELATFNVNYNFRSRNVMNAVLSNMLGLSVLWDKIRTDVENQTGEELRFGRVVDFTDSYHVSTRDYATFESVARDLKKDRKKEPLTKEERKSRARVVKNIAGKRVVSLRHAQRIFAKTIDNRKTLEERIFSKDFMVEWMKEERPKVVAKIGGEIERYCSVDSDETEINYTPEQIQEAKDKLEGDSHFVLESFTRR